MQLGTGKVACLKRGVWVADISSVEINEELIAEALEKSQPEDLDALLTAIEAYRLCTWTAGRLHKSASMIPQRAEIAECAAYCENLLAAYAATGRLERFRFPKNGLGAAHWNVATEW